MGHTADHFAQQVRKVDPDAIISPRQTSEGLFLTVRGQPGLGRFRLESAEQVNDDVRELALAEQDEPTSARSEQGEQTRAASSSSSASTTSQDEPPGTKSARSAIEKIKSAASRVGLDGAALVTTLVGGLLTALLLAWLTSMRGG